MRHRRLFSLLMTIFGLSLSLLSGVVCAQTDTYIINGTSYILSDPQETLTATFTQPNGGVTTALYQGYILLHVTGIGRSYGNTYNDAFYLYTDPFTIPQNGHDGGYYQLTFGTSPLMPFSVASNAKNFLYGELPAYNGDHSYTFLLNTQLLTPGSLYFGLSDGGYEDNVGDYTIQVTQLIPAPDARIAGKLLLTDLAANANPQSLTFTFRPTDGSDSFFKTLAVPPTGEFEIKNMPKKAYTLHIQGTPWLGKNVAIDVTSGEVTGLKVKLVAGDANGDNSINIYDLAILAEAFNTEEGESNYNVDADFNGSHAVTIVDLAILAENFNQDGDP